MMTLVYRHHGKVRRVSAPSWPVLWNLTWSAWDERKPFFTGICDDLEALCVEVFA